MSGLDDPWSGKASLVKKYNGQTLPTPSWDAYNKRTLSKSGSAITGASSIANAI